MSTLPLDRAELPVFRGVRDHVFGALRIPACSEPAAGPHDGPV